MPSSTIEPDSWPDLVDSLPIRMHRLHPGPVAENSVGSHSVYLPTTQVTNTNYQYDRLVPRSELGFQTRENVIPTTSESRMMISKAPICDDRDSKKSSYHDDDSDGSDYSVSSSLVDAMAQVWNENDNSQQFSHEFGASVEWCSSQLPSKKLDAVSAQPTQAKEHNVLPYSALTGNMSTIWRKSRIKARGSYKRR
jgi:hypothetical protein